MAGDKSLNDAFNAYLRGEMPSGIEMATAPRISDWKAVADRCPYSRVFEMKLVGQVTGHPELPDGPITTSAILWIDKHRCVARTMSRVYLLDQEAGE
jgi:hypothetical protein